MKIRSLISHAIVLAAVALSAAAIAAPSVTREDVGDVGSFGHPALYMGAKSGFIELRSDPCPAPSTDPTSRCFQITAVPAVTTFNAENICTIKLPKKATRTIIYPALNFFLNYQLLNATGVRQDAEFRFSAQMTIESDALLDPSIIDPNTGAPANGRLVNQFSYSYVDDRSMDNQDRQRTRITLARVGNAGINKEQLILQGLAPTVVDALFNGPMTIRLSVSGTAQLATDVTLTSNVRLFGD